MLISLGSIIKLAQKFPMNSNDEKKMPLFKKKKKEIAKIKKREDLQFLLDKLSTELVDTEKKMKNVSYQINFFGATPELEEEKEGCELILTWIQKEFDEIKKSLFQVESKLVN